MTGAISVLGSTGSIGTQTLQVADNLNIPVCALAANRSAELLEIQARKYAPELVAVYDRDAARDLAVRLRDTEIEVVPGEEGLLRAASLESAETVVTAVVGTVGLRPTLEAVRTKKRIALANKETLVCAGELVMSEAADRGAEIIPVDSEHSAIFQCLEDKGGAGVKKIILTASGGPFRGKTHAELQSVTPEMALKHPNWNMGAKVTIDSATMMNKGLEFIEAMHLFGLEPGRIQVLVHPQSIVHSAVMYRDNSVIAQMGVPDMRIPIQYALTYPERGPAPAPELSLAEIGKLTFEEPDLEAFKCLGLAMEVAGMGGNAGAVMNAANEEAVRLFLDGKISFNGIFELVSAALEKIKFVSKASLEDILASDTEAREFAKSSY